VQEKSYLKKIKNDMVDDYYTQVIISDPTEAEDDSTIDTELDDQERDLFMTSEYSGAANLEMDYLDSMFLETNRDNPKILERLEWQTMLSLVLTGDVVKSEKRRIITQADFSFQSTYKDNLWLGIRAYLFRRTEEQQRRVIEYARSTADATLNEIIGFKVTDQSNALEQVVRILEKYDSVKELWRDQKDMANDKPIVESELFVEHVDALVSWKNITRTLNRELLALEKWTQSKNLDLTEVRNDGFVDTSFADTMLKEKDIAAIFRTRIFNPHISWFNKSKAAFLNYQDLFEELNLPSYIPTLEKLSLFPMRLIQEIIRLRLAYARKLESPTMMMIDEMIDDFSLYVSLAVSIKSEFVEYKKGWDIEMQPSPGFDETVYEAVGYLFGLVHRKLINTTTKSFRTFKEPDDLENIWKLTRNIGSYIVGAGPEVAFQIVSLTTRLIQRLNVYIVHQGKILEGMVQSNNFSTTPGQADFLNFLNGAMEKFNIVRRKLAKFSSVIRKAYSNSALFSISRPGPFLDILNSSDHFLIQTGYSTGTYLLASGNLYGKDDEIVKILKGAQLGCDLSKSRPRISELEFDQYEEDTDIGYILVIHAARPMLWEGSIVSIQGISNINVDTNPGELMLVTQGSSQGLRYTKSMFTDLVGDNVSFIENRSSLASVQRELVRSEKLFFKLSVSLFSEFYKNKMCIQRVIRSHDSLHVQYCFIRDIEKSYIRFIEGPKKTLIIKKMISFAIDWVSYIVDDCTPTDKKTFRWCVTALEFAMEVSRGFNILTLGDDQFNRLKEKVAGCMSLLISHFDIMGARSSEAEKKAVNAQPNNDQDDNVVLEHFRAQTLKKLSALEKSSNCNNVGKVLDDTVQENQYLSFLASSFSTLSIRWQKRKFIGGGSFGSVYSALNLDTGGILAVKEIRFQDIQSIKEVVPQIKEEMTVLEMLNHPNIVQYYGVEVHRDKVNLFMEYCEGGSLSSLLEHGRIEDETVIQVYSLQMFEGLAYLHDMGIVHRDIKPENILLDHNGIIKFVDFGAAKVIAKNATKKAATKVNSMTGTPMYMSPEVITGSYSSKYSLDVWSTGCCVLEMATGRRPWANLDNEWAIMYHIAAGHLPQFPTGEQLSEAGIKFLCRCLERDPNKRATAQKLLEDPWLVEIRIQAFGESTSSSDVSSEIGV
jgi:mitogen-activated protein kinase kinase kinase